MYGNEVPKFVEMAKGGKVKDVDDGGLYTKYKYIIQHTNKGICIIHTQREKFNNLSVCIYRSWLVSWTLNEPIFSKAYDY